MKRYQTRLIKEKNELDTKIEKLSAFFKSDKYKDLCETERFNMKKQLGFMQGYSEILGKRISAFSA